MPKGIPKSGINKGWLKKGQNLGNINGFKKGQSSWNKGKKTGYAPWLGKKRPGVGGVKKGTPAWNKGKKYPQISGKNHPNWKGGISTEHDKARHTFEMRLWRKSVFERDGFTCQKYGIRGGDLVAHHINNFSSFPELRTSIENGITLSKKAHDEFHKKYGKKNNTREQLNEFLL